MKNKIIYMILAAWLTMLTGCADLVMTENSHVIEKDKTTVVEEPIETGHVDDVFINSNVIKIEYEPNPFVYQMPEIIPKTLTKTVNAGYTYPTAYYPPDGGDPAFYLQSARVVWTGSWYSGWNWHWEGYYYGYTTEIKANCNSTRTDEGYINPVVIRQNDGTYRMWVTSKYRDYLTTKSTEYNYKYITSCYTFNRVSWDLVTETPYFATFNDNSHTGDKGGIVLTNIFKSKIGAADLYIGLYLGKGELNNTDDNWKLYSSYSVSNLINWTRSNGSLFLGFEKSDANFDCVSIGSTSMIFDNDKYMAYYTGINKKRSAIGYAYSGDGVNGWTKNSTEPVYKGTAGKFDEYGVMDPCIIKEDGIYKMYYIGYNGLHYRLGLAYSKDGIKFQYHNLDKYEPIQLTTDINEDIRYPSIFIDQDIDGKRQLRVFYCTKKTVNAQYTNTSGGTTIISNGATIWKVNMALSQVAP